MYLILRLFSYYLEELFVKVQEVHVTQQKFNPEKRSLELIHLNRY